jgi:hypothetical protein
MTTIPQLLAILSVITASLCGLAASSNSGFIFPNVSDPDVPNICNQTFSRKDNITVEYTSFPYTTAISIAVLCFDTVQHALGNDSVICTPQGTGPCK